VNRLRAAVLAALAGTLLLTGCPSRPWVKPPDDAGDALALGLDLLRERRFADAEEVFTFTVFNFPGSRQAADAQFYLAETYFDRGDYVRAQTEYDFYIKSFPNGEFQEQATYKLALAWFNSAPSGSRDQTATLRARDVARGFLLDYPDSELARDVEQALARFEFRLAGRDLDIARLYFKAGEYQSAAVYYDHVTERLGADAWEPLERFRYGVCLVETGRPELAVPIFTALLEADIPAALKQQARARLDLIE